MADICVKKITVVMTRVVVDVLPTDARVTKLNVTRLGPRAE
jgi:hypothetical protein